ncbi:MAG: hypothetical protein LAT64_01570 [Phycisphaerales bacterium]|nr:hypothetical protein [Planctomycetota bacterium]MCH8507451.1 hypothetical protein [Phycisphaerales bacterium]
MSKRAGPPLFELLRKQSEDASRTPAQPEPARRDPDPGVPWSGAGVTRAERSAATLEDEPRQSGELRVPMTRVYMAVAVVLLLVVAAWATGYRLGYGAGKEEMGRVVGSEPVVPPTRTAGDSPSDPARSQATASDRTTQGATTQPRTQPPRTPTGNWVLLPDGQRGVDPRTPGSNYLELATLPADQAQDALAFLASRGTRAIGVPVDSARGDANNPARYTLFSMGLAVPSGQFSSTTDERREHQRRMAAIGADWRRERRGGSDFSQTLWRRYDP